MMKKIIKILIFTIIIIIFLIIALVIHHSGPKYDNYFVIDADFKNYNYLLELPHTPDLDKTDYPAKAHELVKGESIVILYRFFEDPSFQVFDDEEYKKLTVVIDKAIFKQGIIVLPNEKVRALYSSGGSAWPAGGCHGYIKSGTIEILTLDKKSISVNLNLGLSLETFDGFDVDHDCIKSLSVSGTYNQKDFADVTPYLGKQAKSPYQATYR